MKRVLLLTYCIVVSAIYCQQFETEIIEKDNKLKIKILPSEKSVDSKNISSEDEETVEEQDYKFKLVEYRIAKRDNFIKIAERFREGYENKDSLASIVNQIYTDNPQLERGKNLIAGKIIYIRVKEGAEDIVQSKEIEQNFIYYKVKKGDTLYRLARKFKENYPTPEDIDNVVELIEQDNPDRLSFATLEIGDIINIRNKFGIVNSFQSTSSNFRRYRIVKGDTLYKVARKYKNNYPEATNIDEVVEEIKLDNPEIIDFSILEVGDIIKIR